ncbi:hypothetical protein P0W64_19005 [Tsukamurella sp. 8F]|uniref:hypothetical protein n=1 Tax=unclassified Tsukamurella TaxID=2633480 RepID=UPI0023BA122D|nr:MULTISPECIES: hypothetical protein [unclassified Tsukamurella]MDF0531975.1 hypothetical protein [Tsukamurella sp. 8J]MDF0588874.1 hypothetical protein [Tsukamurella sp. 8F]
MTEQDIERIDSVVNAVTAVDGVVGLHPGGIGAPATYLPGRTVRGINLGPDHGRMEVVVELRPGLWQIAQEARRVASEAAGVPVDVLVSDVVAPGAPSEREE